MSRLLKFFVFICVFITSCKPKENDSLQDKAIYCIYAVNWEECNCLDSLNNLKRYPISFQNVKLNNVKQRFDSIEYTFDFYVKNNFKKKCITGSGFYTIGFSKNNKIYIKSNVSKISICYKNICFVENSVLNGSNLKIVMQDRFKNFKGVIPIELKNVMYVGFMNNW